jgi:hypothetical protein
MEPSQQAYLSLVAWPSDLDRGAVADLVATTTGMDHASVNLRLGQSPPMVLGPAPTDDVRRGAHVVIERGGDAFPFTLDDLARPGATLKIKTLAVREGALDLQLWRGLSTTLPPERIQVLVRALLKTEVTTRRRMPRFSSLALRHRSLGSRKAEFEAAISRRVETSGKLDIHAIDGTVFQVDGDKFDFHVLGDLRGYGVKANIDRLCELLAHLAPEAVVDDYFRLWRPPPGYGQLQLPDMKVNHDDPAFAFYSRWTALVYRHVLGEAGEGGPNAGVPGPIIS